MLKYPRLPRPVYVQFDLEDQGQLLPKAIGTLKLVIAWTSVGLIHRQTNGRTNRPTEVTTIPTG